MSEMPRMAYLDYDMAYPQAFSQLAQIIHAVVPDAEVEHVGSTSVPGLGGRGALDTVLISEPPDHTAIVTALKQAGFADFPYGAARPALTYTVNLEGGREYFALVYLLPRSHEYVRGWLTWRDFMRRHPEETERYAAIKKAAIADGKTQPWSYQQAKTPYLVELAQRMEAEG